MSQERIPLTVSIESRDGTLTTDSKCCNGYFEKTVNGTVFIKRPGLSFYKSLPAGQAQGMLYLPNDTMIVVINNTVYSIISNAVATVGTITGVLQTCYLALSYNQEYVFIHNCTNGYLYNVSTGSFVQLGDSNVINTTVLTGGDLYSTSPTVVFSPAPAGGVTATGVATVVSGVITDIIITDMGYGYNTPPVITITDPTGTGATATCLLNAFPPGPYTPGVAYLDGYMIIGTTAGQLWNSGNLGITTDVTSWSALGYVSANSIPDNLVGITRHLNYVIAFGEWGMDMYYDSGVAYPDSPLSLAPSYHSEIGCVNGNSIVSMDNTVLWIGQGLSTGPVVYMLEGTIPVPISTWSINKVLSTSTIENIYAYLFRYNGHSFYVLTLYDVNLTLVYDLTTQSWSQWTMWATSDETGIVSENYFRPVFFAGSYLNNLQYYCLDYNNGTIYLFSDNNTTDLEYPIYYRVVTPLLDSGTTKRKLYHSIEIVGDKLNGSGRLRYTSDDYRGWSNFRTVSLTANRPILYQLGNSRRRAWELLSLSNTPLRLTCLEVNFTIGEQDN